MTGTATPASSSRRMISGTAAAAASLFTVTRTSSEPAAASAITCSAVVAGSAVSVLVIDCTTTGWPEPTRTLPTRVVTVARRAGKGMAGKIEAYGNQRDAARLARAGGAAIFLRGRAGALHTGSGHGHERGTGRGSGAAQEEAALEIDPRDGGAGARRRLRAVYVGRARVLLFEGRARGISAEILAEGMAL